MPSDAQSQPVLTGQDYAMIERIAAHCVRTHRSESAWISYRDRFDAAVDAIVEYIADHGWPPADKPLFQAGSHAIRRAAREYSRHLDQARRYWEPRAAADSMAEAVTDRIGIQQLCWLFDDGEWLAVWSLAEELRRGREHAAAAALAGLTLSAFHDRLYSARRKARQAWAAPGETVRPFIVRRNRKKSRMWMALEARRQRDRRRQVR